MEKKTLGEQAYLALKERIGQLEGDTHLSVRSFAGEIGMSYTPVREAFLRLEREGTLKQIPNVGFFVQPYDVNALLHYYQVRECIESFVLKNVFDQLTVEDMQEMDQWLLAGADAIRQNEPTRFIDSDISFHEVIFRRYGNPHLSNLYRSIREQNMFCSRENRTVSSYATDDHTRMLAAIRAGDREQAVAICEEHIANAKNRMRDGYVQIFK